MCHSWSLNRQTISRESCELCSAVILQIKCRVLFLSIESACVVTTVFLMHSTPNAYYTEDYEAPDQAIHHKSSNGQRMRRSQRGYVISGFGLLESNNVVTFLCDL